MIHSIIALISSLVLLVIEKTGYVGVFLLMAVESANIPVPSEVIMPFSGFLAATGTFNLLLVSIVGALGNLAGSLFSYWLGYLTRERFFSQNAAPVLPAQAGIQSEIAINMDSVRQLTDRRNDNAYTLSASKRIRIQAEIAKAKQWTDKFGDWAILISRVLPVVRTFISFPLGVVKVKSLWRFSILTFVGAFIWSYVLAKIGFVLGENWQSMEKYFRQFDYAIIVVILIGAGYWAYDYFKKR